MQIIECENVNHALIAGINTLDQFGKRQGSRNGAVLVAPWPVITIIHDPEHRVLFNPRRDANPFFHLFESIWMLAGRNDVDFVASTPILQKANSDTYQYIWMRLSILLR